MSYKLALKHFKKTDPVLYQLAKQVDELVEISPRSQKEYFENLCESIISQQLSIKASDTIWKRLLKLFPNEKITPELLYQTEDQKLRDCGISWNKIKYLKDVSSKFTSREINFKFLEKMSDDEVIVELTKIKGIGRWTAEMFLIFTLGRKDVFSAGDQGLKNAIAKYTGLGAPELWSPYRSYACRILWKSLDNEPL